MNDLLELSAIGEQTPVSLKTADGETRKLIIREMDGKNRDEYLTQLRKHVNAEGEIADYRNLQANLLKRSLYDEVTNELLPVSEIEKLPASTLNTIHKEAQRLSKVGNPEDDKAEAAKN